MKTLGLLIPRFGTILLALLVAIATGILIGIAAAVVASLDGRIGKSEQQDIERMTWTGVWKVLRSLPWLHVD